MESPRPRVKGAGARALRRFAANAWPLLQSTTAATVAWALAKSLADHPDPFFAPMSAVVALNASRGERGVNAVRLLVGVVVGIVAGELVVGALGGGYGTMALATFAAMAGAVALGGARVMIAQAATGAILTVAVADGHAGLDRLADALIGAGVALVFTQVLFSPEPVALLRRAEAAALADMADGLGLTARALNATTTSWPSGPWPACGTYATAWPSSAAPGAPAAAVAIVRDGHAITVPEPSAMLRAGDRLIIIGRHQDSGPFHELVVG